MNALLTLRKKKTHLKNVVSGVEICILKYILEFLFEEVE